MLSVFFLFFLFPFASNAQVGVKYDFDLTQTKRISKFKTLENNENIFKSTLPKFDAEELPLFCKIEYKMEKKTRFPVRFRLGTVDVVDGMEGK